MNGFFRLVMKAHTSKELIIGFWAAFHAIIVLVYKHKK
jgi:hypothetical protein